MNVFFLRTLPLQLKLMCSRFDVGCYAQELVRHIQQMRPAVEELARIETEAQYSFLDFQSKWLPAAAAPA